MNKKFQIIIFGASGFTGELCANYLSKTYPEEVDLFYKKSPNFSFDKHHGCCIPLPV